MSDKLLILGVVEVDGYRHRGLACGLCGGVDQESIAVGNCPRKDLEDEGCLFGFCSPDKSQDTLNIVTVNFKGVNCVGSNA